MTKERLLLVALLALPGSLAAQGREPWAGLDAYIDAARKTWRVPGVGLAIVLSAYRNRPTVDVDEVHAMKG